jgi:Cytochrome P450
MITFLCLDVVVGLCKHRNQSTLRTLVQIPGINTISTRVSFFGGLERTTRVGALVIHTVIMFFTPELSLRGSCSRIVSFGSHGATQPCPTQSSVLKIRLGCDCSGGAGLTPLFEVQEAMRAYTAVPLVYRKAMVDLQLGPYVIPRGTIVVCSLLAMHNSSRNFPEPSFFNPVSSLNTLVLQSPHPVSSP